MYIYICFVHVDYLDDIAIQLCIGEDGGDANDPQANVTEGHWWHHESGEMIVASQLTANDGSQGNLPKKGLFLI